MEYLPSGEKRKMDREKEGHIFLPVVLLVGLRE